MGGHGTFYWNELMTRDAEAAKRFYGAMLGWTFEPMTMTEGGTYWVAKAGDKAAGGIFTMSGAYFDGVPEHWFAYVEVDEVDARVARIEAAGGRIMRPCFDIPQIGRIAVIKDANGAPIGLITPAKQGG